MNCIKCETEDNLNATMNIMINGQSYTAYICDNHIDNITPKVARELLQKKIDEIYELKKKAAALGLELVPSREEGQQKKEAPKILMPTKREVETLAARQIDKDDVKISGGDAGASEGKAGGGSGYKLDGIKVEIDEVELTEIAMPQSGSVGAAMSIPRRIVDATGETTIVIADTSDADIQRRFKAQGQDQGDERHDYRHGYDTMTCTLCKGNCVVKQRGQEIKCPKCKGTGMLSRY